MNHLVLAALAFVFSPLAFAQLPGGFQIIQAGVTYQCNPASSVVVSINGPADCADSAYHKGPFNWVETDELCKDAFSRVPALCAIRAYNGPFTSRQAIQLCKGALVDVDGPDACAIKANNSGYTREDSIRLCARGTVANIDCAIRLIITGTSREDAVLQCAAK